MGSQSADTLFHGRVFSVPWSFIFHTMAMHFPYYVVHFPYYGRVFSVLWSFSFCTLVAYFLYYGCISSMNRVRLMRVCVRKMFLRYPSYFRGLSSVDVCIPNQSGLFFEQVVPTDTPTDTQPIPSVSIFGSWARHGRFGGSRLRGAHLQSSSITYNLSRVIDHLPP